MKFQVALRRSLLAKRFVLKDDDDDKEKKEKAEAFEKGAEKAAECMKGVGETIHDIIENKKVSVKNVVSMLGDFASLIPGWGPVIGAVFSIVNMFLPGEP